MITPEGKDFNYASLESATQSPLAQEIFAKFNWVDQVFFMNNFVTITKGTDDEWFELVPEIKDFILAYF
jgi:hypothetical protein